MTPDELRAAQTPRKEQFRESPQAAQSILSVRGTLDLENIACRIETGRGGCDDRRPCTRRPAVTDRRPVRGYSAGVARGLRRCERCVPVATAMDLPVHGGTVIAEGDLDFQWDARPQQGGAGRYDRDSPEI